MEIIVVVVIFGILFAALFETLVTNRITWDIASTRQIVENQARVGLDKMARELYATNPDRVNITGIGNQTITFQVPVNYDINGNLIWGANDTPDYFIRYSISGNQLLRQTLDNTGTAIDNRILADDIGGLQFSLSNVTSLLNVTLTAQRASPGNRTLSQAFSSQVTFRN